MSKARWAWAAPALALALSVVAAPAQAQPRPVRDVGNDLKHLGEDVVNVWISPVRGSGRDWLGAAGVVAAAAALSTLDDEVDRWAVRDSASGFFDALKPVRRGGKFYGGSVLAPYVVGAYVAGIAFDKPGVRDGVMGCGASAVANSVARKVFYRVVGRARPDTAAREGWDQYHFEVPNGSGHGTRSFPGGHVANVMSCAAFLGNRFEWGYGEVALYGLVAAVGVGRVADRGHWLSDQVVGSALGYAIGRTVATRQLERKADRERGAATTSGASGFYASPDPSEVRIGWRWSF